MLGRREFFTVFLWRLLLIAFVGYILWRIRSLILVVIIAVILYYCLAPFIKWLQRRRFWGRIKGGTRRALSAIIVIIISLGVVIGASYLLLSPLIGEARSLEVNITKYSKDLAGIAEEIQKKVLNLPPQYQKVIADQFAKLTDYISVGIRWIIEKTVSAFGHILEIFLIPIIAFYLAIGAKGLRRELFIFIPPKYTRKALLILREMDFAMRQYIVGQFIACLILWITVWGGLAIIGMDFPLLLGVLAGITRAIPIVGPIAGGTPIVLLALIKSPISALYVLAFFSVLQFIDSKFILPLFIGHQMRLHPITIILAVFIGGEFFGILGMFMATPVAAAVKSLFQIFYTHGVKS
ncbi:MAG: AI-2E family transporter [bacterium]